MYERKGQQQSSWPDTHCDEDGCIGVLVPNQRFCLAHVHPSIRQDVLNDLTPKASLDLRGTPIGGLLLDEILDRLADRFPANCLFDRAQFTSDVAFEGRRFGDGLSFARAQFSGRASFEEAQFAGQPSFLGTRFEGPVSFFHARFTGDPLLGARFSQQASFTKAKFTGNPSFRGAQFAGDASFRETEFTGAAGFYGTQFTGNVSFDKAKLNGSVSFQTAQFNKPASFTGAQLRYASFDQVEFTQGVSFNEAQLYDTQFTGAVFTQDSSFNKARISGASSFVNAHFDAFAWFKQAQFTYARFGGAHFGGDAWFQEVQATDGASFSRVQFNGNAHFDTARIASKANFTGATFTKDAGFDEAQLTGGAWFNQAVFNTEASQRALFKGAKLGSAQFREARFTGDAVFRGTEFGDNASFSEARFERSAEFNDARFTGDAAFIETWFSGDAVFRQAEFTGNVSFDEAKFRRSAEFNDVRFTGDAAFTKAQFLLRDGMFQKATFASNAAFDGARFNSGASFERVEFTKAPRLGPLSAGGQVILDRATFGAHALVEVAAARLSCVETQFPEGADLRLRDAEVALDGAVFAKSSTIAAEDLTSPDTNAPGQTINPAAKMVMDQAPRPASGRATPRLLSLRRVDVSMLTLANVNLEPCLFAGAHNLDKLRIEGPLSFARTPPEAWRIRLGRWQVPIWKWTNRQALAEEHHWRAEPPTTPAADRFAKRLDRPRWSRPGEKSFLWLKQRSGQAVQPLDPHQLTALYRTMRKGREDNKDEPGAADFYYGEMEMRRKAAATPGAERLILTVYWLVSGYGLRGLRALAWLAIVTVGLAVLLQAIGFNRGDPSFRDALIYATQSTLSLASSTKALTDRVSWAGEALRIVLRLTGPILLALAVLSVRNRIKR